MKLFILFLLTLTNVSYGKSFTFDNGGVVHTETLTLDQADKLNSHMTSLVNNGVILTTDSGNTCFVSCTDHVGYEIFGKPLHSSGKSYSSARVLKRRHKSATGHDGIDIWCGAR